jgi:hypothetical protein
MHGAGAKSSAHPERIMKSLENFIWRKKSGSYHDASSVTRPK